MALRGDPRILLVFSILACNTKINNFFALPKHKTLKSGAACTSNMYVCTVQYVLVDYNNTRYTRCCTTGIILTTGTGSTATVPVPGTGRSFWVFHWPWKKIQYFWRGDATLFSKTRPLLILFH
jgi:hypothetical protein